jgi:hypothetical protein
MISIDCGGFLFQFPLYSYTLGPNRSHGFLGSAERGVGQLPLWTDRDLVERYLSKIGVPAGSVEIAEMASPHEAAYFLRTAPSSVADVIVDTNPVDRPVITRFDIKKLAECFSRWREE